MAKVFYHERENRFTVHKMIKPSQESRSAKSGANIDSKYVQVHRFVEEPVTFNFGGDYGNKLFVDSQKEMAMINWLFYAWSWGKPGTHRSVKGFKYSDDEIYTFSSVEHVIDSFANHIGSP